MIFIIYSYLELKKLRLTGGCHQIIMKLGSYTYTYTTFTHSQTREFLIHVFLSSISMK